jgi:microcystin-dependent protein
MDAIDGFVSRATPIGAILDFAGPTAPSGWLICDGRWLSRVTYSKLFAVIGTYWGAGDGSTTFAVPNMNGRSGVGPGAFTDESGASYSLGFTSLQGFVTRTITQAYLPDYALNVVAAAAHNHTGLTAGGGKHGHATDAQGYHSHPGSFTPSHTHTGLTDVQGDHTHGYIQTQHGAGDWVAGSSANQITITAQQTDPAGPHFHNLSVNGSGNLTLSIVGDGSHSHVTSLDGDHVHGIYYDGGHTHTATLGGGGSSLKTLSPIAVVTKIIYAGAEAAIVTAADIAAAPAGSEIEALREEIAALRALFETPRARMLSAPSRGPH